MDFVQLTLEPVFRWMHILAGIIWIGLLYFFNFVNGPFAATMNGDTKKLVVPELMPRALYWFRWGAAWTWLTGVLLLMVAFYHGGALFMGGAGGWGLGAIASLVLTFAGFAVYDAIQTTSFITEQKMKNVAYFALTTMVVYIMSNFGGFGYRGYVIHIGAMFGTAMAFNVWFRIWPAQQQIITAIKNGNAPDASLVALAGLRSKHNTYMSGALIWMMIDTHTQGFLVTVPPFSYSPELGLLLMILVSWHVIWHLYNRAGKVKGF